MEIKAILLVLVNLLSTNTLIGRCNETETLLTCAPEQILILGSDCTVYCMVHNSFQELSWYSNSTHDQLILKYKDSVQTEPGVSSGKFDIHKNGSLIIRNVSLEDEHVFGIVVLFESGQTEEADINVIVIASQDDVKLSESLKSTHAVQTTSTVGHVTKRTSDVEESIRESSVSPKVIPEGTDITNTALATNVIFLNYTEEVLTNFEDLSSTDKIVTKPSYSTTKDVTVPDQTSADKLHPSEPDVSLTTNLVTPVDDLAGSTKPPSSTTKDVTVPDQTSADKLHPSEPDVSLTTNLVTPVDDLAGSTKPPSSTTKDVTVPDQTSADKLHPSESDVSLTTNLVTLVDDLAGSTKPPSSTTKDVTVPDQTSADKLHPSESDVALTTHLVTPVEDPAGATDKANDNLADAFTENMRSAETSKTMPGTHESLISGSANTTQSTPSLASQDLGKGNPIVSKLLSILLISLGVLFLIFVYISVCTKLVRRRKKKARIRRIATEEELELLATNETMLKKTFLQELKTSYQTLYEDHHSIAYVKNHVVQNVFVENGIEKLNDYGENWERVSSYHEIFKTTGEKNLTMLTGDSGYGKTTLSLQAACDWSTKNPSSPLKDIEIVILLRMGFPSKNISLYEAIKLYVLDRDTTLTECDIRDILNNSSSLMFILDGLNECGDIHRHSGGLCDISKLMSQQILPESFVVATTTSRNNIFSNFDNAKSSRTYRLTGSHDAGRLAYVNEYIVEKQGSTESIIEM
ncbi:uncharacterized protein [Apostichopus japonicus]|uniref:uncharacterized protein n=1 Tax=Stichopus japonicus TaxID=307972 RepID=UPI003AB678C4